MLTWIEGDGYFKKYYNQKRILKKLQFLIEYYRYHFDVPRFFVKKLVRIFNRYHDVKRMLYYKKMNKELNINQEK